MTWTLYWHFSWAVPRHAIMHLEFEWVTTGLKTSINLALNLWQTKTSSQFLLDLFFAMNKTFYNLIERSLMIKVKSWMFFFGESWMTLRPRASTSSNILSYFQSIKSAVKSKKLGKCGICNSNHQQTVKFIGKLKLILCILQYYAVFHQREEPNSLA